MTASRLGPTPEPTSEAVTRSMKGNRARDTTPELTLRRLLRGAGYPGYRLHWGNAPGHPDVAYPGRKIAVFVNGCFWHRCPHCQPSVPKAHSEFWRRKFELNAERDVRKQRELESAGWTVFTAWECRLRDDPQREVRAIIEALRATATPARKASA